MPGCIVFDSNSELGKCRRCADGFRLNETTDKCFECSGIGKTGYKGNIVCNFFSFDN